jgi:F-type H+-transporting ATPase subunit a
MHPISIVAEPVFHIGSFAVTNTLLTSWVVVILLVIIAFFISRTIKGNKSKVPGKLQNATEGALDTFLNFMTNIAGDRATAIKFLPICGTIFFFILLSNWLGVLPGVGSLGFYHMEGGVREFVPFFRSVNSDINTTLALALIVVTLSHIIGFVVIGTKKHLGKFFRFTGFVDFGVGLLEIVSEVSRIVSLSFRLFGNVFAGEVLLVIITFLVPYIVPLPFLALEVFVGFIQALIFATLAMMYFASATHAHEAEHEAKH